MLWEAEQGVGPGARLPPPARSSHTSFHTSHLLQCELQRGPREGHPVDQCTQEIGHSAPGRRFQKANFSEPQFP